MSTGIIIMIVLLSILVVAVVLCFLLLAGLFSIIEQLHKNFSGDGLEAINNVWKYPHAN
jgi:hypothetical protein